MGWILSFLLMCCTVSARADGCLFPRDPVYVTRPTPIQPPSAVTNPYPYIAPSRPTPTPPPPPPAPALPSTPRVEMPSPTELMKPMDNLLPSPESAVATQSALGEFGKMQETDQIAVMHLEPSQVTVDMYIAIDGIPAGKSVTYILPFWHRPTGFVMEAIDGPAFRTRYVQPAVRQLIWDSARQRHAVLQTMYPALTLTGVALFGPLSPVVHFPAFSLVAPKGELRDLAAKEALTHGPYSPYVTAAIPVAKAALYQLNDAQDLQTLLARSGLPETLAKPLAKYHTQHFAIMTLTGTGDSLSGAAHTPRGVHYHFSHPMPQTADYTYTYPLGTGAGWARPIVLTEVFLTCPPDAVLKVTAPEVGEKADSYQALLERVRTAMTSGQASTALPATASLAGQLDDPTSWHRAYFNSNPADDLSAQYTTRKDAAFFTKAAGLTQPFVTLLLSLLALALSWGSAVRFVIAPAWKGSGCPDSLLEHTLHIFGVTTLAGLGSGVVILGIIGLFSHNGMLELAQAYGWLPYIVLVVLLSLASWALWRWIPTLQALRGWLVLIAIPLFAVLLFLLLNSLGMLANVRTGIGSALLLTAVLTGVVYCAKLSPYGHLPRSTPVLAWLVAAVFYLLFSFVLIGLSFGIDMLLANSFILSQEPLM